LKNDHEKLKDLFEMKEKSAFNSAVIKAKTVATVRTIAVSLMIFIIASFILLLSNAVILNKMNNEKENSLRNWFNIAMPNAYFGNIQADDGIMTGEIDYVRYRFLGSKPVSDGSYKEGYTYVPLINGVYGDMGNLMAKDSVENAEYNKSGKRIMQFYHPAINYKSYVNDLNNLSAEDNNKLMEISLSFDRTYSIDEIKNMIPEGITLNWYWVDTSTSDALTENGKYKPDELSFDEYEVYGIKTLDSQGVSISNPEELFISSITMYKDKKGTSPIYQTLFNTLSNGKGEIKKSDLKIIGVVVSGKTEVLKTLKGKNYIKAATIGAVTDKY